MSYQAKANEDDFARARREAREGRDAIERLARIEAEDARRTRNRLEKGSPSAGRRDFAGILNALVADAAAREMPGLAALEGIRKGQRHGYKTAADHNRAHERFEFERAAAESSNRLHPRSKLASAPVEAERDDARYDRIGPNLAEARRLLDAAGSLIADARTARDHWASGKATGIRAEFLLDAAIALINAANARARQAV
jgi:hypothetical protein